MLALPAPDTNYQPINAEELLFRAALLAGLGSQARSIASQIIASQIVASQPIDSPTDSAAAERTCIEGGSSLLISLQAPGDRALQVWTQVAAADAHSSRWLGTAYAIDQPCRRWEVETFFPARPTAWQHTLAFAQAANQEARLRHYHPILGLRGRLFQTTRLLDAEGEAWVTWQLDRGSSVAEAIAPFTGSWGGIAKRVQMLFGRAVGGRSSPWSVACNLADPIRWRIGTTMWARLPEDPAKHRRLAATVAQMGGDDRFAEAMYKLLDSARSNASARIGRAIEIEVAGDAVKAMHFYLSVPSCRSHSHHSHLHHSDSPHSDSHHSDY